MKTLNLQDILKLLVEAKIITSTDARSIDVYYPTLEAKLKVRAKNEETGGEILPWEVIGEMKIIRNDNEKELTEEEILNIIGKNLNISVEMIDPLKIDINFTSKYISKPFAIKNNIIPLRLDNDLLVVAVSNPFNQEPINTLSSTSNKKIKVVLSPRKLIDKTIRILYGFNFSVKKAEKTLSTGIDVGNFEQLVKMKGNKELEATDSYVVNAVDYMLRHAIDQRASDIHLEPKREDGLVRFRIDGVLHAIYSVPKVVHNAIIARIKTLARMNIAEKRRPQDGRIKTTFEDKEVEFRISIIPVAFGEKVVMRILNPDMMFKRLKDIGFSGKDLEQFDKFISQPHGIILITGPTGSGKTTTLYSTLKKKESPELNIVTIEDPIEMIYEPFNQINVNPAVDLDFATTIKYILRQDPDVIMVGEIRDYDTARNAIQAALTGHLVFSTLHTNDAPSAITRLTDLGIPPYLISSTLIGIVAQRLVRKICDNCKTNTTLENYQIKNLGLKIKENHDKIQVYKGKGCNICRNTGYLGRTAIFEILPITENIQKMIASKVPEEEIRKEAIKNGMRTLKLAGIKKVLDGETTYEEVMRVII